MSVRFSADSIVAPSSTNIAKTQQAAALMNGQSNFNSMCSKMETQALMDTQHQGGLGTPDANITASYMSSDFKSNQQHHKEQHLNNNTSQTGDFGTTAADLFSQLQIALALEPKYQPSLFLPLQSNVSIFLKTKNYNEDDDIVCWSVVGVDSQGQGANNFFI